MSLLSEQRKIFHKSLINNKTLTFSPLSSDTLSKLQTSSGTFHETEIVSNADSGQRSSIEVANALAEKIALNAGLHVERVKKKKPGQTLGNQFEQCCANFIGATFTELENLRPGTWIIEQLGSRKEGVIGQFEQYSHLSELLRLAAANNELKNFLGEGYTVAPDVVVARVPETDEVINSRITILDKSSCLNSKLRKSNHKNPDNLENLLHASISCKFSMRSDRAQNTRTEALNLIRSRKGRSPHIVSVVAEPMPSRIASLALGTGDLDCVYHFALYELKEVLQEQCKDDALDSLLMMIEGKRLKDISDLPLDLSI